MPEVLSILNHPPPPTQATRISGAEVLGFKIEAGIVTNTILMVNYYGYTTTLV